MEKTNAEARPLSFTQPNEGVDELIERLMDEAGGVQHRPLVREMILAALKAGQESRSILDLKLMNTTLKEMRFTAKVFAPYRHVRKVTVFGSARTPAHEPIYAMARDFGRCLAEAGFMVITGGGPGIMQAANEGAGPEHSFGVNIRLPFEQTTNPVVNQTPRSITYKYFFNRKVAFLKEAAAVALFPGGFGTLDETMETLTLLQTGKHNPIPLVLLEEPDGTYWVRWMRFLEDELLSRGLISPNDFYLFRRIPSVDGAVDEIRRFYRRYHSLRYVKESLILRLSEPLPEGVEGRLNREFQDILRPGGTIRIGPPHEDEKDEPDCARLTHLYMDFNRRDFGRLRQLIDAVNNA
ncbi:MAG: TIGR00730 family Rossman fold protein [Desulfosoma sp.]